jgi:hypothetical protein
MYPFVIVTGIVLNPFYLALNLQGQGEEEDYDESLSQFAGNLPL